MITLPKNVPLYFIIIRFCVFLMVWLLLTQANLDALSFAVILLPLATLISLYLFKPNHTYYATLNIAFLPRFLVYFVKESLSGGVNTALLAINPRAQLSPTLVTVTVTLENESARVVFAQIVSLLPGTLSVHLDGQTLVVHTLNQNKQDTTKALLKCENMMNKLFSAL